MPILSAFSRLWATLRLCDLQWPADRIRMHWIQEGGWRPVLSGAPIDSEIDLCSTLGDQGLWAPLEALSGLGNNLTVPAESFGSVVFNVVANLRPEARSAADFLAAFGNEVFGDEDKNRITYTDLSFITGSGHQHFLGTARTLQHCVSVERLREALFGPWRFADDGNSFRWDPEDAKEYALRWRNPSVGGVSSVWGANRLAFEALPFFAMVPGRSGLKTTAFNTAQSELRPMGIGEVFRAQRVRIGQGANFKVSFRPARAV